jgi:replicative DNA helicase
VRPIKAAEKALIADAEPAIAETAIRRRMAEAEADKTAKAAENALHPAEKDAALAEAARAKLDLDTTVVPATPRLFSDDATVEVLTSLLYEQADAWRCSPRKGRSSPSPPAATPEPRTSPS